MDDHLYKEMHAVEQSHWWFQARSKIVKHLLARYLSQQATERPKVLDLGCGCGLILTQLQQDYDCAGMDAFDQAIDFCSQRGITIAKGFLPDQVPFPEEQADAVLFLDVLEHLDQDAESVRAGAKLLRSGGIIIASSPAYEWLWTSRDDYHQHRRRYTRSSFRKLFQIPNMQVEFCSYANTLLFPLALAERLYRKFRPLPASGNDLSIPPAPVNALLRESFSTERFLLGRFPLPWGLSVMCVARKV